MTGREGTELDKLSEEQRCKLNNIGLLFCIVLRDTTSDQTLEKILISQFELREEHLDMLKCNIGKVTLILDGFDELSYNEGEIIKVIQGKLHQGIHYIVTCRPHASQGIVLNADSEIRLKGFSESQSKAFIEMFARKRFEKEKDVEVFISKTWKEITSSVDLIEMSTNPSMLQLICLLSSETGKIGKDRAEVFKHYTKYLLTQYHTKHESIPYSDGLYKDILLKTGKLAMFGLKQNHLQLVFSKEKAHKVAGSVIFDIGFLTELPSRDPENVKVQFIHKSLQEYLAAFHVVNTPEDDGMKLLMEFSSTSQRLFGSQIILTFIAAMSRKMSKEIQNKIRDYISTWDSNDDVDPKSRTSFLLAMLKDNKKLTFPLPALLDIDLQVYDLVSQRIRDFIKSLFGQKSTLDIFLNMDGRGVKKLNIGLGKYNRLGLFMTNSFNSVEELLVNYKKTWSKDDPKHLAQVITKNKPRLVSITNCVDSLFHKVPIAKGILTQCVQTLALKKCQISKDTCLLILQNEHHLKTLVMQDCGIHIDAEIAKAVCNLPDETQIDLSGNKIDRMESKLLASLIYKIRMQKQINLAGLNIDINTVIAKAVCDLPDETKIDLSGNKVVTMNNMLLTSLLYKIKTQTLIDVRSPNVQIDPGIAKAITDLPDKTQIELAGNKMVKLDTKLLSRIIKKVRTETKTEIDVLGLCIRVSNTDARLVWETPDENQEKKFVNEIVKMDIKRLMSFINKIITQKEINLSGSDIDIDSEIAKAVCDLPDETKVDLSGNKIVKMDNNLLVSLIYKVRTQKYIDLRWENIEINKEIAKAVCALSDETQIGLSDKQIVKIHRMILITLINKVRIESELDLSGLYIRVDDREACVIWEILDKNQTTLYSNKVVEIDLKKFMSIIYKITNQKEIDLSWLDIHIDTEIVMCISHLPEDVQLDLSGNEIPDESLIVSIIKQSTKLKSVTMRNCGIEINEQIAEAVSELNDDTKLDLSGNEITKMKAQLLEKVLNYMKLQEEINIAGWMMKIDLDIVKAFSNMVYLKTLRASNNALTSSACNSLVHSASLLPDLQELYLSYCGISDGDCVDLVYSLSEHCRRLEVLFLGYNHLSYNLYQVLDDVSKMKNLRWLGLWGNPCMNGLQQLEQIKNILQESNPQLTLKGEY